MALSDSIKKKFPLTALGLSVLPLGFSLLLLALSYPFFGSTDGWSRWQTALIFAEGMQLPAWYWTDIFPPLMSVLMGVAHRISGEFGWFTFMQGFATFYCLSVLVWTALKDPPRRWWVYSVCLVCILANPLILNRVAQVYPEPLLSVGLIILALLLVKGPELGKGTFYPLLVTSVCLTVGFRYNAVVLAVPLLLFASIRFARARKRTIPHLVLATAVVLSSCAILYRLPKLMGMQPSHNVAYILVWDYVGTVLHTPDPQSAYQLDAILPINEAIALYDSRSNDALQWGPDKIKPAVIGEHKVTLVRGFFRLVYNHPGAFLELRLERLVDLLTLRDLAELDGPFEAPDYSSWGDGGPVDINFEPVHPGLRDWLVRLYYREGHHWLYRPPFVIGLAGLLLLLLRRLRLPMRLETSLFLVAILYYLTFAILTPKCGYRFFFPSYLLLTTVSWMAIAKLVIRAVEVKFTRQESQTSGEVTDYGRL